VTRTGICWPSSRKSSESCQLCRPSSGLRAFRPGQPERCGQISETATIRHVAVQKRNAVFPFWNRISRQSQRRRGEPSGTHQMLSLRSLAFIRCSAIRRVRALSCAAIDCSPDIINGRKMATNKEIKMATTVAAPMYSLLRTVYRPSITFDPTSRITEAAQHRIGFGGCGKPSFSRSYSSRRVSSFHGHWPGRGEYSISSCNAWRASRMEACQLAPSRSGCRCWMILWAMSRRNCNRTALRSAFPKLAIPSARFSTSTSLKRPARSNSAVRSLHSAKSAS
jgi:hypothetical protein